MVDETFTKCVVNSAVIKVLTKEMDYFDAVYTDPLIDKLSKENAKYRKTGFTSIKIEPKLALEEIQKHKYCINDQVLSAYGWTNDDVEKAIMTYLPDEHLKSLNRYIKRKCGESEL